MFVHAYPISKYKNLVPSYITALTREIEHAAEWVRQNNYHISSVYVGGGTPTSIDADSLYKILSELTVNFDLKGL